MLYQHNRVQAIFLDVEDDALEDVVIAHDTEQVRTWKNMGNFTCKPMANSTSNYFAYPMGIANTDFSEFTEVGAAAGVVYREFGIAPITADFNQDGFPDLVHINLFGPQNIFISKAGRNGYLKGIVFKNKTRHKSNWEQS